MSLSTFAKSLSAIMIAAEDLKLSAEIACEHDEFYIQFSADVPEDSRLGIILDEDGFMRAEDNLFILSV